MIRVVPVRRTQLLGIAIIGVFLATLVWAALPAHSGHTSAISNNRIVFMTASEDFSSFSISTMNADGSDMQNLSENQSYDAAPRWSPDGAKIAFSKDLSGEGDYQIMTMNADGTNVQQITSGDSFSYSAVWSPDGTKFAYLRSTDGFDNPNIWIINADGTDPHAVTTGADNYYTVDWSPDGSKLLATYFQDSGDGYSKIRIMNIDGSLATNIVDTSSNNEGAEFSPDGTKIVYIQDILYDRTVHIANIDGSDDHIVDDSSLDNTYVSWSPDGTKLVLSVRDSVSHMDEIYSINIDGSDFTRLTNNAVPDEMPDWRGVPTSDGDNISAALENAAPNSGDANGDGIQDSLQNNVTSLPDPVSGSYATLQSSCAASSMVSAAAEPADYPDTAFDYPAGLMNFTLFCSTHGATATVTQFFYGVDLTGQPARKFNATAHTYQTLTGATISKVTIGGQAATKVVYQITDGSSLDQDGTQNGKIVDPAGVAKAKLSAPNSGYGASDGLTITPAFSGQHALQILPL